MKRLILVVFLVLVAAVGYRSLGDEETGTGTLTLPQPAPNAGEVAPSFEAREAGENEGSFELSGKGVYVLTFWSTLNKDTAQARPEFAEMARDYGDEGVSFAAVYVNSVPENDMAAPYAVLHDGSGNLTALYNVKRVPRLFLIEDGKIALVQNGFYPENDQQLEDELARVLEEET